MFTFIILIIYIITKIKFYNPIIYKLKMIKFMKIFAIIILLFITSCLSFKEPDYRADFKQRLEANSFGTSFILRKNKGDDAIFKNENEIKIIKLKADSVHAVLTDLMEVLVELKNKNYKPTYYVSFSTDEKFFVYEDILKDFCKSKDSDILVYAIVNDVLEFTEHEDLQTLDIIEKKGHKIFGAYLFSKTELNNKINN